MCPNPLGLAGLSNQVVDDFALAVEFLTLHLGLEPGVIGRGKGNTLSGQQSAPGKRVVHYRIEFASLKVKDSYRVLLYSAQRRVATKSI